MIDEAEYGQQKNILIPVLIEDTEIPIGFQGIEAANLNQVTDYDSHPEFINLIAAIKAKLSTSPAIDVDFYKESWPKNSGLSYLPSLNRDSSKNKSQLKTIKPEPLFDWANIPRSSTFKLQSGVIFEDHFASNANRWFEKRNHHELIIRVQNGKYVLDQKLDTGRFCTWNTISLSEESDFEIEVNIAHKYSSSASIDKVNIPFYGVLWGGVDANNYYTVEFSYDGHFCYRKLEKGKWYDIIPWQKSYHFNQVELANGMQANNKIKIAKKSNIVEFRLNDVWVEDAEFESFFGSATGFEIHGKLMIEVDYIKVTQK